MKSETLQSLKDHQVKCAIETRYLPPTNHRGSRVIAAAPAGQRLIRSWEDDLDALENHRLAARALADKLAWKSPQVGGALRDSYVWVFPC